MGIFTEIRELLAGYPSFYAEVYGCCIDSWEENEQKIQDALANTEEADYDFDDFCDICYDIWKLKPETLQYTLDEIAEMVVQYIIKHHETPVGYKDLIEEDA